MNRKYGYKKRVRTRAMKSIYDFFSANPSQVSFNPEQIVFEEDIDPHEMTRVLYGLGLIDGKRDANGHFHNCTLTDKGFCYFEVKYDELWECILFSEVLPLVVAIASTLLTLLVAK